MIVGKPGPRAPVPTNAPKAEAGASGPATPPEAKKTWLDTIAGTVRNAATTAFEGVKDAVHDGVDSVKRLEQGFERSRVDGKDGFVVIDPVTGQVDAGQPGGVAVTSELLRGVLPDGLATILGLGDPGEPVTYKVGKGPAALAGETNLEGYEPVTLDELNAQPLKGLDPKRGGLLKLTLGAEGQKTSLNVLALPRDYDGPIFFSDIDDTLRPTQLNDIVAGETQQPIPGAKELLDGVAKRGVPIVYLSAGLQRMGPLNDDFLKQMPDGILLARKNPALGDISPRNSDQAKTQGDYKAARLAELRKAYPNAKFYGIGDDKYGDAMAYTKAGATAYIHDVRPGNDNIPSDFKGTLTTDYTDDFRAKVLGDLDTAIAGSASFQR